MKTEAITFRNTFRYCKVKRERLGTKFLSFDTIPRKPYLLTLPPIWDQYILKKWIALKVRSHWLVKHRTSFAICPRATREKMASQFASVTSEEIIEINFMWCILPRLGKYPPLATSTSVNSCYLFALSAICHYSLFAIGVFRTPSFLYLPSLEASPCYYGRYSLNYNEAEKLNLYEVF